MKYSKKSLSNKEGCRVAQLKIIWNNFWDKEVAEFGLSEREVSLTGRILSEH